MNMDYLITTICFGVFEEIALHWKKKINNVCKNHSIEIYNRNTELKLNYSWAFWDVIRLNNNIKNFYSLNIPIVHIDIDIVVEKNIEDIVNLPYDIIFSEEGKNFKDAWPVEYCNLLGFGICTGFYVIKKNSIPFMQNILNIMKTFEYNTYSDQHTLLCYIVNNKYTVHEENIVLDNKVYTNKIIEIDNIKICVLDFDIISRNPLIDKGQYGNHLNINLIGKNNLIDAFYKNVELIPLSCNCKKSNIVCHHIELREKLLKDKNYDIVNRCE